ncbi:Leucine rich repeat-containing protein [Lachnospiraceae bacterium]|nr:Leucine rich repeat-containing protein [Lachnospiraceae bacterium]
MRKKLLIGLMSVAMASAMLAVGIPVSDKGISSVSSVYAAEDYLEDWSSSGGSIGFAFTVEGSEASIIHLARKGTNPDQLSQVGEEIIIPSTVTDDATGKTYTVTTIGTSAFALDIMTSWAKDTTVTKSTEMFKKNELKISIPDSVKIIGDKAFYGGSKYTFVDSSGEACGSENRNVISSNVISIGESAFQNCSGLKGDLVIPSSVESIGKSAFQGTGLDNELTFDAGTKALVIGESAFSGLKCKLFSFDRSGIQEIGKSAFSGMGSLTCEGGNLFPVTTSLTKIGDSAFSGDSKLDAILNLPQGENLTYIGTSAFYNCSALTLPTEGLIIPQGITTVNDSTFYACEGLAGTLNLNNVTSVGKSAFGQCVSFRGDLNLSKVTSLGDGAFSSTTVYGIVDDEDKSKMKLDELAEDVRKGTAHIIVLYGGFDGKLILSNQLTTIPSNCFNGLVNLNGTLTIPSSVTTIGAAAFSDCYSFTGNLVIPESVTTIGNAAFKDMIGINGSLSIPSGITVIGNDTFKNCFNMTGGLKIPSNVTGIGNNAFYGCRSLTGSLVFPTTLKSLGSMAFYYCSGFTGDLIIPDSVTSVGISCFEEDAGFNGTLKLSENMTAINNRTFYNLEHIKAEEVIIPNKVTSIGVYSFYNCVGIQMVRMERNVTKIDNTSFHALTDNKMKYHIYKYNSKPYEHVQSQHPDDYDERVVEIPDVNDIKVYRTDTNGNKTGNPITATEKIAIPYGKSVKLYAESFVNGKASGYPVKYESLNTEMLAVNASTGVVSIKSKTASGEAKIAVKDGNGGAAEFDVIFTIIEADQVITGMSVKDKDGKNAVANYDILVGDSLSLTVTDIIPTTVKAENQNISWSASDPSAVSITKNDAYGHSVSLGGVKYASRVTVIADADYGSGNATKRIFTINVYPKAGITSVVNVSDGIQISWPFTEGASGYEIFRKINSIDKEAKRIGSTKKDINSFVDTTIASNPENIGKTIVYYVVASGAGKDNKSKELSIKYANNNFTVGNTKYIMNSDGTVTYAGSTAKTAIVSIPQTVRIGTKDAKVKAVAANAFSDDTTLTTVVIPDTVKTIGANAFKNCKSLKTVTMGTGVTSIGANAFTNCKALTSIVIPKKVKTIGKAAFSGCSKLKTVTFKTTKLTKVGSKAFKTIKKGATFKIKKSKFSKYKKLIKKSGVPKKAKYKKTK